MTITEALAEIKTIGKRITKKREAVQSYLARQEMLKDPLAADGGSVVFIQRERQAIADLEERIVGLRRAIAKANAETIVAVNGDKRSIADWLTWRREVAPGKQQFLAALRTRVEQVRREAIQKGLNVVSAATAVASVGETKPSDVLVNVSEAELAKEIEAVETELGALDGLLSLNNATTQITL